MITEIPPRYWGSNVAISGNAFLLYGQTQDQRKSAIQRANAYQDEVYQVLDMIAKGSKTRTGQILKTAINNSTGGKALRIVPFRGDEQDARTFASNIGRAIAAGEKYKEEGYRETLKARGGGSNVVIAYEPRNFISSTAYYSALPTRQFLQDDVLYHELVHALRMMRGLLLSRNLLPATGRLGFKNVEEFYAILLTDIYVSECGRGLHAIRVDHAPSFHSIEGTDEFEDKTAQGYYEVYGEAIRKLIEQMNDVTQPIGDLTGIDWNPLRYHYHPVAPVPVGSVSDKFDALSGTGSTHSTGEGIPLDKDLFPGWTPKN